MRVGSGVILFQLAGFLTSALADFYFAKHICVWQVGIQPARQRKSNHFGSEIQPPYCSAIALSNVANGNSAHHA